MSNDEKSARFHQSNGFFNLTDFSYKVSDTVSYYVDPSNFTLNYPPSVGAPVSVRSKRISGFLYDWKNPCKPRNISQELSQFTLPFKDIIPRILVQNTDCYTSQVVANIISAVSSLVGQKFYIHGVYILRDDSIPCSEFAKIFERPVSNGDASLFIYGTAYYTGIGTVLGSIPPNSLGSILENNPNIKPSEIKGPVVYQEITITGVVPDTEGASSNEWFMRCMLALIIIANLIVGFIAVKQWINRRTVTQRQIELNAVPQAPKPKTLPVLAVGDLEKIECLTYDSKVLSSEMSRANTTGEQPSTSTVTRNLLKRTFTSQSMVADPSCSICLETFKVKEEIRKLPHCNHVFHKECIDGWLLEQSCCCPNCRYDMRIALGIEIEEDVEDGGGSVREEDLQISESEEIAIHTEIDEKESEQKQTEPGESKNTSGTSLEDVVVRVKTTEEVETRKN
ncbi:hypothetical protein HK098_006727 [Nowakowskiella sp. JEL0407]|nr:hypothetical protein HK098_006727 [Nowakowskiella sp. JEL0407]